MRHDSRTGGTVAMEKVTREGRERTEASMGLASLVFASLALASLALLLTGCPLLAPHCEVSLECESGTVCRSSRCQEVSCSSEADCGPHEDCPASTCAALPCERHGHCPSDQICDDGECLIVPCASAAECPTAICEEGQCRACRDAGECPGAERSVCLDGSCFPHECDVSSECADGGVCVLNGCVPCGEETPCEGGQVCMDGACVPCMEDEECGPMASCRDGVCFPICVEDSQCPAALGCRGRAQSESSSCGETFCRSSSPTPFPRTPVCDPCQSVAGGCPSGECDQNYRCTCASNEDCANELACREGSCSACSADSQCRCDQYCSAGECHDRCRSDAECAGGRCHATGRCVRCITDSDCPGSERCFEDGCVGPCDGGFFSCAPFVPCSNGRCGLCANCREGAWNEPIRSCP